jgi:hypothetical protein
LREIVYFAFSVTHQLVPRTDQSQTIPAVAKDDTPILFLVGGEKRKGPMTHDFHCGKAVHFFGVMLSGDAAIG